MNKDVFFFGIFLIFFVGQAQAQIFDCTVINSPGNYTLNADIIDSSADPCIAITVSDVTLDGQGHTIDGIGATPSTGILVESNAYLDNIHVSNVILSDWGSSGIRFSKQRTGSIVNTVVSNSGNCISLGNSSRIAVQGNEVSGCSDGIILFTSSENTIESNNAYDNTSQGIRLNFFNTGNSIVDNVITRSGFYGLRIHQSNDNQAISNTITDNSVRGLNVSGGSVGNLIYDNYFDNESNASDFGGNSYHVSPTPGINIVGGPFLGGNFWQDYEGVDTDGDSLGDTLTPYTSGGDIVGGDEHPLVAARDSDLDGITDGEDNCIYAYNPEQDDADFDGVGNDCDNCRETPNPSQVESEQDLIDFYGDACDNCKFVHNPSQRDANNDGVGDLCEHDENPPFISLIIDPSDPPPTVEVEFKADVIDLDGILSIDLIVNKEKVKTCPISPCSYKGSNYTDGVAFNAKVVDIEGNVHEGEKILAGLNLTDFDSDGVPNVDDNCPFDANANQKDSDVHGDLLPKSFNFARLVQLREDFCRQQPADLQCKDVSDGVGDVCDNCIYINNEDQADLDGDGAGDACDQDIDSDGIEDVDDNCPAIPNFDQSDSDGDAVGDLCDNCRNTPNSDQSNYDGDASGDACDSDDDNDGVADTSDNCQFRENANQKDSDNDGVGNLCDNCVFNDNSDQADFDLDGLGDGCDCDDDFWGPNEDGIDCGGVCNAQCPACIPVVRNGSTADKVDVVFLADTDYADFADFRDDVRDMIENGYFGNDDFRENACKFNFYYHRNNGNYVEVCQAWNTPSTFNTDCSFADSTAILFTGSDRACSTSGIYSVRAGAYRTLIHEVGHNNIGSADEYCCDGGYFRPSGQPNIYNTQADCEANSLHPENCTNFCPETQQWNSNAACVAFADANGLDNTLCVNGQSPMWCSFRGIDIRPCCVDGGDGWWKADSSACILQSGASWEPDDQKRVNDFFAGLKACDSSDSIVSFASLLYAEDKVLILNFNMSGEDFALVDAAVAVNDPPNNFLKDGDFRLEIETKDGSSLEHVYFHDPRELHVQHFEPRDPVYDPGMLMRENADFTLIVRLYGNAETILLRNLETGAVVYTLDVLEVIDPDGDGVFVGLDACPNVPGLSTHQGCLVADDVLVELHVIDREGVHCGGEGSCRTPIEGAEVKVFARNNQDFQTAFMKTPRKSDSKDIFNAGIGLVGKCITDAMGKCQIGEEKIDEYYVVVKYYDEDTRITAYTAKPKGKEDFEDSNGDGIPDLAEKDFKFEKIIEKDGEVRLREGPLVVFE